MDRPTLFAAGLLALGALLLVGVTVHIYSFWPTMEFWDDDDDFVEEAAPVTPPKPKPGRKLSTPPGVLDALAAVEWLAGQQQADGSWPGQPDGLDEVAVTAVCVEGLLVSISLTAQAAPQGQAPTALTRGFDFLLSKQGPDGRFSSTRGLSHVLAAHALWVAHENSTRLKQQPADFTRRLEAALRAALTAVALPQSSDDSGSELVTLLNAELLGRAHAQEKPGFRGIAGLEAAYARARKHLESAYPPAALPDLRPATTDPVVLTTAMRALRACGLRAPLLRLWASDLDILPVRVIQSDALLHYNLMALTRAGMFGDGNLNASRLTRYAAFIQLEDGPDVGSWPARGALARQGGAVFATAMMLASLRTR